MRLQSDWLWAVDRQLSATDGSVGMRAWKKAMRATDATRVEGKPHDESL